MAISFRQALGIHPEALSLRAYRAEVLSANMANADTPNYKARDIDFRAVLSGTCDPEQNPILPLQLSHCGHLGGIDDQGDQLLYRIPSQPSVDGNSVDPDLERSEFASNAIGYQSSFTFLNGRISTLLTAIRGE